MKYTLEFTEKYEFLDTIRYIEQLIYYRLIDEILEDVNIEKMTVVNDRLYNISKDFPITIKNEFGDVVYELKMSWV